MRLLPASPKRSVRCRRSISRISIQTARSEPAKRADSGVMSFLGHALASGFSPRDRADPGARPSGAFQNLDQWPMVPALHIHLDFRFGADRLLLSQNSESAEGFQVAIGDSA